MKALVINTARMGDLIQSTPLMQGLQGQGYEVTLLYSDGFASIIPLLAGVDRAIPLLLSEIVKPLIKPDGRFSISYRILSDLSRELKSKSFDLVVNATHSAFSAHIASLSGAKNASGLISDSRGRRRVQGEWGRYYLTSQLCRFANRFNLVDIHRKMGGVTRPYPVKLNVPAEATQKAVELLGHKPVDQKLVAVVPGASTVEKSLPPESFATAIKLIHQDVPLLPVILGAKSEVEIAGKLAALLPGSLNLAGRTTPAELAAVLSKSDLLLSNDTGPMHIAAAVGTPVIEISLGSALATETAPYGEGHYVIEARIDCHPCLPRMRCTHFSCGKMIPPKAISKIAVSLLSGFKLDMTELRESQVNIYRTEFDPDGFLVLNRLAGAAPTANDILFDAMREILKTALDGKLKDVVPLVIAPSANSELIEKLESFEKLCSIAAIGEKSASTMVALASLPKEIETLKKLSTALIEIDRSLAQLAYARPEVMPFIAQFTSAKENITSTDLIGHAAQTAELFRKLSLVSRMMVPRDASKAEEIVDAA